MTPLVIGAGLAGTEAAWQIARAGLPVHLVEMRPLRRSPAHHSAEFAELVCSIRRSKLPDPSRIGNAGSFFKNPVVPCELAQRLRAAYPDMPAYPQGDDLEKLAAGWLIDQAGWRGVRRGSVGVNPEQALVLALSWLLVVAALARTEHGQTTDDHEERCGGPEQPLTDRTRRRTARRGAARSIPAAATPCASKYATRSPRGPLPRSSTVSPCFRSARLMGFPQPRPRLASPSATFRSSS